MLRLADKVAILTGAASGIGAGTAEVFAEHGARLVLVDRDSAGLESVRARLDTPASPAITVCGDVADAATIEHVVAAALSAFGRIDVVFNNAGIMPTGELRDFAETTCGCAGLVQLSIPRR
jgi:NADP-dependent 3-hydroxy acid dehydrogenase YdfG